MIELAAKRLEILRELVPNIRHLAIMAHVGGPGAMLEMAEVQATARKLGIEAIKLESGAQKRSRQPLRCSRAALKHFMFAPTHS
jgi:hypothetical protein